MIRRYTKLMGGILLVAGTTTGAAMLALPVVIGFAGFVPAVCLYLLCWGYFTYTALLMLEVNLWMGEDVNLITMAKKTLGLYGELFAWIFYLFLLYALTTAYIAGSGSVMVTFMQNLFDIAIPEWAGPLPLMVIFGFFVYHGTRHVDLFNRFLMIGLAATFVMLIGSLIADVSLPMLRVANWPKLFVGVSVVVTSFGYHIIIPSLTHYFHADVRQMKRAIVYGSLIPLVCYILWTAVSLGIIPLYGAHSIDFGYTTGENGADLIATMMDQPFIASVASFFAFFAIITSFLGVSLSLSDFLQDGLRIKKIEVGRVIVCLLAFAPPFAFSIANPRAFLLALEYAGAFGVVTLLGLLPALMVWGGRYEKHLAVGAKYRVAGGKPALIATMAGAIVVVLIEIVNQLG